MQSKNTELKSICGEPHYIHITGEVNRSIIRRYYASECKFYGSNRSRPFASHEDRVAAARRRAEREKAEAGV